MSNQQPSPPNQPVDPGSSRKFFSAEFNGARFGSFQDLKLPRFIELFKELEEFSTAYGQQVASGEGWPETYPWPLDALHTNTRIWEYPFALDALRRFAAPGARILDIGSALTFFPSFLASSGYEVVASDIDPAMESSFRQLQPGLRALLGPKALERIAYRREDVTRLSLEDHSIEAVTNISVLEHLPFEALERAIIEIRRVLVPGGLFICTLDTWMRGGPRTAHHSPLDQQEFEAFMTSMLDHFELLDRPRITVPRDLITNLHCPLPTSSYNAAAATARRIRPFKALRALFNRPEPTPLEWSVFGTALESSST
ncbi:MAG: class I SAM-dependent methyltransferase [Acidobacteriota bacterium]|nr:class I SAM-dependent methyltransferase [Acidobacteriota bacterium]